MSTVTVHRRPVTLRERIIMEFRQSPGVPIATPDLVRTVCHGRPAARQQVWAVLLDMEKIGEVRRVGYRVVPMERKDGGRGTVGGTTQTLWQLV